MKPIDRLGLGPTREERKTVIGGETRYQIIVTPPRMFMPDASPQTVCLTEDQYQRYRQWRNSDVMIQDALPDLSSQDRERLLSGIGPGEWASIFDDEED